MANILFVLPASGYSGGANSVVQETKGLLRIGEKVAIAIDDKNIVTFKQCYATQCDVVSRLLVFNSPIALEEHIEKFDIVIATVGTFAATVFDCIRNVNEKCKKNVRSAYYIQDYEPLFFDVQTNYYKKSCISYDTASDVICFAKTDWICQVVESNHSGVKVKRVLPSIDHDCYFPIIQPINKIVISAMVRPSTPRRGPRRTVRILKRLAEKYGSKVQSVCFGCDRDELIKSGLMLHPLIINKGRLTREQVAQVLRESSLFLDLSDYQAFGRTGIESMACGAVPVMPLFGGASEFITHGQNGYLVDTRYDSIVLDVIEQYIQLSDKRRSVMQSSALETAAAYSVHRAAISVRNVLLEI